MQKTREKWVQSLGWEATLEQEMTTHSSILAWKIPWTGDPWVTKSWTQLSTHTTIAYYERVIVNTGMKENKVQKSESF